MPFFLYQYRTNTEGSSTFQRLKRISIGGKNGPVAAYAIDQCEGTPKCGWHMSEIQLLKRLDVTPEHAVLVDLKPTTESNVSLYRLQDIWGFSYKDWPPVCLKLESLFIDKESEDPEVFKEEFDFRREEGGLIIHEFLYLNGGVSEGTWKWGMNGSVNGALLFQDAWEYLSSRVNYANK